MAEETNPWKRQMMMNKQNSSPTPPPPSNNSTNPPTQMGNPWKQKISQQNISTGKVSTPSWVKTTPSPVVEPSQSTQPTNPWKTNSPTMATNPWMKGKIDKQKQQKEKQQKQRLQRQQQQRKKKQEQEKRLQEQRIIKQQQSEQRQRNQMKKQDQLSVLFQESEKARQQQQAKAKTKSSGKNKSPAKVKSPTKSKTKQKKQAKTILSVSNLSSEPDNSLASRYYISFQQLLENDLSFAQRLQKQKQIISIYKQFENTHVSKIKQLIQSHQIPQFLKLEDGIQLEFIKIKSERKDSEGQVIYDEKRLEEVRTQIELMNGLQNTLVDAIRKRGISKIRVALRTLIQYKGVSCFVKGESKQEEQTGFLQVSKFPEILTEVSLLIKDMNIYKEFTNLPLKVEHFVFKNAHNSQGQQIFILSLNGQIEQLKNLLNYEIKQNQFTQDFNWFDKNLNKIISSSNLIKLQESKIGQYFQEQIKTLKLSKTILQIYRSAQGQLDDENFIRVVIKMKKQFTELLQDSGVKQQLNNNRGFLLLILEKLTGLILEFNQNIFKQNQVKIKQYIPLFNGYSFNTLEVVDISNKYLVFLQEDKLDLAQQAMLLRQDIQQNNKQKTSLILDRSQFLYLQQKYQDSINELESIRQSVRSYTLLSVRMLTLYIKNYIALSRQLELLEKFSIIISELGFIFGQQTQYNTQLYLLLATFYSKRQDKFNEVLAFYQLATNIVNKRFGQKSVQLGDIYLAKAHTFISYKKFDEAQTNLQQACKIYQSAQNKLRKAETILTMGKLAFAQSDKKVGDQCFNKSLKIYERAHRSKDIEKVLLLKLTYQKDLIKRQLILHQLYKLGNQYNSRNITKNTLILILKQQLALLSRSKIQKLKQVVDSFQVEDQGEQQIDNINSLQQLEKTLKVYNTISELIHWLFSLLDSPGKIDKHSNIIKQIKEYIGEDKFNETINCPF